MSRCLRLLVALLLRPAARPLTTVRTLMTEARPSVASVAGPDVAADVAVECAK